jgi:hypothetical protein
MLLLVSLQRMIMKHSLAHLDFESFLKTLRTSSQVTRLSLTSLRLLHFASEARSALELRRACVSLALVLSPSNSQT